MGDIRSVNITSGKLISHSDESWHDLFDEDSGGLHMPKGKIWYFKIILVGSASDGQVVANRMDGVAQNDSDVQSVKILSCRNLIDYDHLHFDFQAVGGNDFDIQVRSSDPLINQQPRTMKWAIKAEITEIDMI